MSERKTIQKPVVDSHSPATASSHSRSSVSLFSGRGLLTGVFALSVLSPNFARGEEPNKKPTVVASAEKQPNKDAVLDVAQLEEYAKKNEKGQVHSNEDWSYMRSTWMNFTSTEDGEFSGGRIGVNIHVCHSNKPNCNGSGDPNSKDPEDHVPDRYAIVAMNGEIIGNIDLTKYGNFPDVAIVDMGKSEKKGYGKRLRIYAFGRDGPNGKIVPDNVGYADAYSGIKKVTVQKPLLVAAR